MNIKNRIKKLESEIDAGGGEFCACFSKHNSAIINRAYGEPYNAADILPNVPLAGICSNCNRSVNSKVKELHDEISLIYGGAA